MYSFTVLYFVMTNLNIRIPKDAAICIAVMHHLSTVGRRLQCLRELRRVVKVGGLINVQAWAIDQDSNSKRKFAVADAFVPFNAQPRYLEKVNIDERRRSNASEMYADAYEGAQLNAKNGLVVFQRYCHLYEKGELEQLVQETKGLEVMESGFESGNYFVILKSTSL